MTSVNPLVFSCSNLSLSTEGKSSVLRALLKGPNGKEYHIRVVGKDEAEVNKIFDEQKQKAIAIFEAVGQKPIELTGDQFDTLKKGSPSSSSGKKIGKNFIQEKEEKVREKQGKLESVLDLIGKDDKKEELNTQLEALKKDRSLKQEDLEKIKNGDTSPLETILKKLSERVKCLEFAENVLKATFEKPDSVKKERVPAPKKDELQQVAGDLPGVPVGGITGGCVNQGNSCWLNASLKLMAAQNHFDPLLNAKFSEPKSEDSESLKNLRQVVPFLKIAVNQLRSGGTVSQVQGDALLAGVAAAKYVTGKDNKEVDVTGQHDGAEFLESLLADWAKLAEGEIPGVEPYKKPIFDHDSNESRPLVTIIPKDNNIDMSDPHFLPEQSPDTIMVNVQRHIAKNAEDGTFVGTERCDADLAITKYRSEYFIKLSGHDYKIKGMMTQAGGVDAGHWTYLEIRGSRKVYSHSDMEVKEISEDQVIERLKKGSILYLEKFSLEGVD